MNVTETGPVISAPEQHDPGMIWKATVVLIILFMSLFGNGFIIGMMVKEPQRRTVINAFVSSLSVSDLLVTLFSMPLALASLFLRKWPFGEITCALHHYISFLTAMYTSFNMMFIAVDRYVAVVRPSHWRMDRNLSAILIGSAWCLSLLLSIPWDIHSGRLIVTEQGKVICNFLPSPSRTEVYRYILSTSVGHILPIILTLYCLTVICAKVYSVRVKIRPPVVPLSHLLFQSEMHTATTAIIIISAYLLCWLPYVIVLLLTSTRSIPLTELVYDLVILLTWINKACNPVIYAIRNKTLSRYLKGRGCCWRVQKTKRHDIYKWPGHCSSRNASVTSESSFKLGDPSLFFARSSVDSDIALTAASGDMRHISYY